MSTSNVIPFRPRSVGGDDQDPMETPGAAYCADCGAYPVFPTDRHVCQD